MINTVTKTISAPQEVWELAEEHKKKVLELYEPGNWLQNRDIRLSEAAHILDRATQEALVVNYFKLIGLGD